MLKPIEEGQVIYVTEIGWVNNKPNLTEFTVTKFNNSSFYARPKSAAFDTRFNRKTWKAKTSLGDTLTAYEEPEEYWKLCIQSKEKKELKKKITEEVKELSGKDLKKVWSFMLKLKG